MFLVVARRKVSSLVGRAGLALHPIVVLPESTLVNFQAFLTVLPLQTFYWILVGCIVLSKWFFALFRRAAYMTLAVSKYFTHFCVVLDCWGLLSLLLSLISDLGLKLMVNQAGQKRELAQNLHFSLTFFWFPKLLFDLQWKGIQQAPQGMKLSPLLLLRWLAWKVTYCKVFPV